MKRKLIGIIWLLAFWLAGNANLSIAKQSTTEPIPHYYCTAANKPYFRMLLNLIGSIHKHDFLQTKAICVYDLGLTPEQLTTLSAIEKVVICEVEQKNPDILKLFSYEASYATKVGSYSWKPVVIKQALELQPYFFWIDAGLELTDSMDEAFEYLLEVGHLFHNGQPPFHASLERMLNLVARENFSVTQQELCECGLESGFMGITQNIQDSFVYPAYEAAGDIGNFLDFGIRGRRHDQAIFSLFAVRSGLSIHHHNRDQITLSTPSGKNYRFQYCNYPVPADAHPNVRKAPTRFDNVIHHYDDIRYKVDHENS